MHHPVLDPAAAGVRGLRRRQADEQPQAQDEADQGGAQQQPRTRQEAGKHRLAIFSDAERWTRYKVTKMVAGRGFVNLSESFGSNSSCRTTEKFS